MSVVNIWKHSLAQLLAFYDSRRGPLKTFFPKLLVFFIILNISCYWWAIITAYPNEAFGPKRGYYFLVQFPVGFLGALFDSLSFFVTVHIARRALRTTSTWSYIAHLSVDVVIAVIATWWVLLVFSLSGWLIGWIQQSPESLVERGNLYERRLMKAVTNPTRGDNLKNIYFGVVMGISAFLPTWTHLTLSLRSMILNQRQKHR